jgi:hypothetical protein
MALQGVGVDVYSKQRKKVCVGVLYMMGIENIYLLLYITVLNIMLVLMV